MALKKVEISELEYTNELGFTILTGVEVSLDEDEYKKYKEGCDIDRLDYGLSGRVIERAEKQIAITFFKTYYRKILEGKYQLKSNEIIAIQELMNLNNKDFSTILGIDKASFSNILKRDKMSRSVGLLIIERLGMELSRPGSAQCLVDSKSKLGKPNAQIAKQINEVRYGIGEVA